MADVLNKAISSVPDAQLKESQSLKDLHQGLQLTESQLLKVFSKHGLVQENPLGEKFDPNKHDALFQVILFAFYTVFPSNCCDRSRPRTKKPTLFSTSRKLVTFSMEGLSDLPLSECLGNNRIVESIYIFYNPVGCQCGSS